MERCSASVCMGRKGRKNDNLSSKFSPLANITTRKLHYTIIITINFRPRFHAHIQTLASLMHLYFIIFCLSHRRMVYFWHQSVYGFFTIHIHTYNYISLSLSLYALPMTPDKIRPRFSSRTYVHIYTYYLFRVICARF